MSYTGTACVNCGRNRVLLPCRDGQSRCEKCSWNQQVAMYDSCGEANPAGHPFINCACGKYVDGEIMRLIDNAPGRK